MAAGPIALIGWLTAISLALIVAVAVILTVTGIHADGGDPPAPALAFPEAA